MPARDLPVVLSPFFMPLRQAVSVFCVFALLTACEREEIRVYTAPKDPPAPPARTEEAPRAPRPQLAWTLPEGWQQVEAGQVSVASFTTKSEAGEASVQITPLPNLAGKEAMVVNMWRQQLGQPALSQDEVTASLTPVEVAGETGQLFEVPGEGKRRIVTAMIHKPDASWFFKLAGDDAAVEAQKPAFVNFLKSVQMKAPAETAATTSAADAHSTEARRFKWTVPEGWRAATPGQMQVAKFTVPERGTAKAEVTVSTFPSDTGGTLANVNRWRRQLGLGEVDEAGLAPLVSPLDPSVPNSVLVDLTNEQKRMLGAIVPRGAEWFFYKLVGDADAVAAERESFIAFAKSNP